MAWSNPGIRYLLLHAKLSPTSAAQNNTNHLLSHRVPEGKESRNDLVGQFWLRFSDEIVVKMPAKTAVLWRLEWAKGSSYKMACSHGCGQEASVPHHKGLPTGCLWALTTWQLASPERPIQEEARKKLWCLLWPSLGSHTLPFPTGHPTQQGRGLQRSESTRKPGSLGAISEAGYHKCLIYPDLFWRCTYFCFHTAPYLMDLKLMTCSIFCLTWSNNSARFFHQVEIYLMILASL